MLLECVKRLSQRDIQRFSGEYQGLIVFISPIQKGNDTHTSKVSSAPRLTRPLASSDSRSEVHCARVPASIWHVSRSVHDRLTIVKPLSLELISSGLRGIVQNSRCRQPMAADCVDGAKDAQASHSRAIAGLLGQLSISHVYNLASPAIGPPADEAIIQETRSLKSPRPRPTPGAIHLLS